MFKWQQKLIQNGEYQNLKKQVVIIGVLIIFSQSFSSQGFAFVNDTVAAIITVLAWAASINMSCIAIGLIKQLETSKSS